MMIIQKKIKILAIKSKAKKYFSKALQSEGKIEESESNQSTDLDDDELSFLSNRVHCL